MIKIYLVIVILSIISIKFCVSKLQIKVGGIFHDENSEAEIAFNAAVHSVNVNDMRSLELIPIVIRIPQDNAFRAEKAVCELTSYGVSAIFGPFSRQTIGIVESMASQFGIPHFLASWIPEPAEVSDRRRDMTVNLYPESNRLARALSDLIVDSDWKRYTVIYENEESLMKLKDILQIHEPNDEPITVRQLPEGTKDYRSLLKEIKTLMGDILVEASEEKAIALLEQAKSLDMCAEYQRFIFTSIDTHSIDLSEMNLNEANITTMKLIDTKSFEIRNIVNEMIQYEKIRDRFLQISPDHVHSEPILVYDAVKIFAKALLQFKSDLGDEELITPIVECRDPYPWNQGREIINRIKNVNISGLSGPVLIDDDGHRQHMMMHVIEWGDTEFNKIGEWNPMGGIRSTRLAHEILELALDNLQNKVVKVVSKYGDPFLMDRLPEDGVTFEGNNRYEGFLMDLIQALAEDLKFEYKIEIVPDHKYGNYDPETKDWNGIVRHVKDRKADIGLCDLTITYERRTAVDFTMPFMDLGISILYVKPTPSPSNLFSFLSPLSLDVWLYTITAYTMVSFLIFVLSRMAPDEWISSHPCNKEVEEVENIWNSKNSTWVTMGSIMGQGSDLLPKAISTRIITGLWWFFALIMLASYTANMAAFLTMERMDSAIENVEELAAQSKVKYGCLGGGSTIAFFRNSNNSMYQKMWTVMEQTRPSVFTETNQQGADRVEKSKKMYAFFMESSVLEYIVERNCALQEIGQRLDSKGYGIALPMNSLYRKALNRGILKLQENGQLAGMKKRWWKEERGGNKCHSDKKHEANPELGVDNVGGVFVVLLAGCVAGLFIGICEFLWNVRKVAVEEGMTPFEALKQEFKFAINISVTTKPVHKKLTETGSCYTANSRRSSTGGRRSASRSRSRANLNNI